MVSIISYWEPLQINSGPTPDGRKAIRKYS